MSRMTLVPGWTARSWVLIARFLLAIGLAAAISDLIAVYRGATSLVLLGFTAATLAAWLLARTRCARAEEREALAGYSTLVRIDDPTLNQVDGATRIVVRKQGTPMLSAREFILERARLRRAFGASGHV